jgi:transposase
LTFLATLNPFIGLKNKVMQQSASFIGIDISKLTLDICVWEEHTRSHFRIPNEVEAINAFIVPLLRKDKELHIGMENTGCYNYHLYEAFNALGLNYYVIPPLHLKRV